MKKRFFSTDSKAGKRARVPVGRQVSPIVFLIGLSVSTLSSAFAYTPKNTVVATVPVGILPSSLVVSPDSSTVYVGNEASDSISVIDAATRKVGSTISVSGQPFYLAITPDGLDLYCTEIGANVDLELSTARKQLVQSYPTGSSPGPQAISPDGSLIYVSNYGDGTVSVISNGTPLSPIAVGGNPIAVIFAPDGSEAYVANQGFTGSYSVSVIDTATNTVSAVINSDVPYPFGGLAISPDGTKLYLTGIATSNNLPVVAIIDTADNQVTDTIELLQSSWDPGQPAITPNGKFLYVPVFSRHSRPTNRLVVMIRTAIQKLVTQVDVGRQPTTIAVAPDGKYA